MRPGGPCFFTWNFGLLRAVRDGSGSIVKIWPCGLRRDQQFAPLIAENSSVSWPLQRLRGYPAWCTLMPLRQCFFWGVRGASRSCGAVRRDSAFRHGRKLDGAPSLGARP